jgi:hypothetical protein
MHTRETLGLGWWRSAAQAGKLALWMGIVLLLAAPLPGVRGAEAVAVASATRSERGSIQAAGDAFRFQGHAHVPARAIAPQATDTLSGKVVNANGSTFGSASSPNLSAGISVMSFDGTYNFTYLANDGTFSIALEAGIYDVSVWLDDAIYPGIGAPEPFSVGVSGVTDIGEIRLVARNARIEGDVTFGFSGQAAGVQINAWGPQGETVFTTTNLLGHYILDVTPGTWQVSPDLFGNPNYIFTGTPEITDVGAGQSVPLDFKVEPTSGTISGSIFNGSTLVTDIVGWAYVNRNGEAIQWAPISNGSFSMPAPTIISSDVLTVGLYIDPNSSYSSLGEIRLDNNTAPNFTANMLVQQQDALIAGHVYIAGDASHTAVTNVVGQVVLTQLDDSGVTPITKFAPIDPGNGSYSVSVLPGDWLVTYQIFTDTYQADLSAPILVRAAGQLTPQDLPLTRLDGFVTAVVRDQNGVAQPNVTVWVRFGTQEVYADTDFEGKVTVYVPYSSSGLVAGVISPQGQQQPPLKIGTSYSSCNKSSKLDKSPCDKKNGKNSSLALTKTPAPKPKPGGLRVAADEPPVALALRDTNSTLTGRVLDAGGLTPRKNAFVSAWSSNGQWISDFAADDGTFSLPIAQDSTISTIWNINASYWYSDTHKLLSKRVSRNVAVGQAPTTPIAAGDLVLEQSASALPPSESQHFKNSEGLTLPLSDGTLIQIPKGAIPDGFGPDIRITVDPQIALPSTDLNRLATFYGYAINLFDVQTGKPIEQPLKKPATLTFSYTSAQLQQLNIINEADLQPAQFAADTWHVAEGFLQDTRGEVKTISLETTSLDSWALVVEQGPLAGGLVYMPLVKR